MASTDQPQTTAVEVVQEFHQRVMTEKDLDAAHELIAQDYIEHNPALPAGELQGRETIVEFWEELFEGFPDLWIDEVDVFADGDTVVTRHVGRGTHEGEFMDLPASGNEFEIGGIDIYEVRDGKISEAWINLDMLGLMEQLEAIPTAQEGGQ